MLKENVMRDYIAILSEELVPATGCTEPIAIAYCAATVKKLLGKLPERVTATVSGNSLYMLFDANAILKLATNLTSNTSSSSISTILKSYNGLKLGWTMTK